MNNYVIVFVGIIKLIFIPILTGALLLGTTLLASEGIKSLRKKATYKREV